MYGRKVWKRVAVGVAALALVVLGAAIGGVSDWTSYNPAPGGGTTTTPKWITVNGGEKIAKVRDGANALGIVELTVAKVGILSASSGRSISVPSGAITWTRSASATRPTSVSCGYLVVYRQPGREWAAWPVLLGKLTQDTIPASLPAPRVTKLPATEFVPAKGMDVRIGAACTSNVADPKLAASSTFAVKYIDKPVVREDNIDRTWSTEGTRRPTWPPATVTEGSFARDAFGSVLQPITANVRLTSMYSLTQAVPTTGMTCWLDRWLSGEAGYHAVAQGRNVITSAERNPTITLRSRDTVPLSPGGHRFRVTCYNEAGNDKVGASATIRVTTKSAS